MISLHKHGSAWKNRSLCMMHSKREYLSEQFVSVCISYSISLYLDDTYFGHYWFSNKSYVIHTAARHLYTVVNDVFCIGVVWLHHFIVVGLYPAWREAAVGVRFPVEVEANAVDVSSAVEQTVLQGPHVSHWRASHDLLALKRVVISRTSHCNQWELG